MASRPNNLKLLGKTIKLRLLGREYVKESHHQVLSRKAKGIAGSIDSHLPSLQTINVT